uniref:HP domain-containing protein n=1 Tax=Dunaliella tertiolecta TaxID=3047 RepID=A0A7S3VK74_DUNTE
MQSFFEQASHAKMEQAAPSKLQLRTGASPSQSPVKVAHAAPKANGQISRAPAAVAKAVPSSPHDLKNTVNASQLLKTGAFSRVPGKDHIKYEELILLRLEDSIDVTRKEDYLSQEEFEKVFEMTRETYEKLPGWKRVQAKKRVHLF